VNKIDHMSETSVNKYIACMVLGGSGDAIGYNGGSFEFANAKTIWQQIDRFGGVDKIDVRGWLISDDTVMNIATAEGLVEPYGSLEELYTRISNRYIVCMDDMRGRAPGNTCIAGCRVMQRSQRWDAVPFNQRHGGCGAAMRSMCIGLRFPGPENRDTLTQVAIETGRMTHHHASGYLGAVVGALFTAYALEGIPPVKWGALLMHDVIPRAREYVLRGRQGPENADSFATFVDKWTEFLQLRGIEHADTAPAPAPAFPAVYGVKERDEVYTHFSFDGWGGASGYDAPLIAYDALLWAGDSWINLVSAGCLHSGDSDSTGTMACAWWGAMKGFEGVCPSHHLHLEYRERLVDLARRLHDQAHPPK